MSDQVSKPTTLYVGNDPEPVDVEMAGLHRASRSEVIEALGIDYEAGEEALQNWNPDTTNAKTIVDAALGLEDDDE